MDDNKNLMDKAEDNLYVASAASGDSTAECDARAYNSQQAAEKAIKAAITYTGKSYRFIHNLTDLANELPPDWSVGASTSDMDFLTKKGAESRYGDNTTKADADKAFDIASDMVATISNRMP